MDRNSLREAIARRLAEPTVPTDGPPSNEPETTFDQRVEAAVEQEIARQERRNRALVTYGDTVLLERPDQWSVGGTAKAVGNLALEGLNRVGEAALAMPPSLGPPGALIHGAGKMMRAPGEVARYFGAAKTPQTMGHADDALAAAQSSYDDILRQVQSFRPDTRSMPQVGAPSTVADKEAMARLLAQETDQLSGYLGDIRSRMPPRPPGSVPQAGNAAAQREVLSSMDGNPYAQAVPGRQGFMRRPEIDDALRRGTEAGRTFDDMGSPGPWGRDVPAARREYLGREQQIQATGRHGVTAAEPNTFPEGGEAIAALRARLAEIERERDHLSQVYRYANERHSGDVRQNRDLMQKLSEQDEAIKILRSLLAKFAG